jgi:NMD protein affecting ribosome stability and mRNA decay
VHCPHCQQRIENPATALKRRRKAAGKCVRCGDELEAADRRHVRCRACRVYEAHLATIRRTTISR